MLLVFVGLLVALALFTAYTRNYQRTVVALGEQIDPTAITLLTPRAQALRTVAVIVLWPLSFGFGMLFIAWWKAVALVVGAYVVLVPVMGTLTPRARAPHYLMSIRRDLARRAGAGDRRAGDLRALAARLDQLH